MLTGCLLFFSCQFLIVPYFTCSFFPLIGTEREPGIRYILKFEDSYIHGQHHIFPRFPSVTDKLLLLDVGSCFNPFAAYNDIDPLAIDLQPAISVSMTFSLINA